MKTAILSLLAGSVSGLSNATAAIQGINATAIDASSAPCSWTSMTYSLKGGETYTLCCFGVPGYMTKEIKSTFHTTDTTFGDAYTVKGASYQNPSACSKSSPFSTTKEYKYSDSGTVHTFDERTPVQDPNVHSVGFVLTCHNTVSCAGSIDMLVMV